MKQTTFCLAVLTVFLAIIEQGLAAPILYFDRASFLGDTRVATTTDINFDNLSVGTDLTNQAVSGVTFGAP